MQFRGTNYFSLSLFVMASCLFTTTLAFVGMKNTQTDMTEKIVSRHTMLHAVGDEGDRRSFLVGSASMLLGGLVRPNEVGAVETRQGIEVTAFNGLIFNYRGGGFGGLDASTLNEPSIPYAEFYQRLQAGEVEFVEFQAPDGDAAYVTFKPKSSEEGGSLQKEAPIRIGEGYPIEQHDGYSSPAFAIRAVKNAGVPYKFIVPGLAKYQN